MKMYVVIKTGFWYGICSQDSCMTFFKLSLRIKWTIDLIETRSIRNRRLSRLYLYLELENGIKISKIYRQKVAVDHVVSKGEECGTSASSLHASMMRDHRLRKRSVSWLRTVEMLQYQKEYPNSLILALEYEEKRNILILGTGNGDIIFYDVDKNRATNCIEAKGL